MLNTSHISENHFEDFGSAVADRLGINDADDDAVTNSLNLSSSLGGGNPPPLFSTVAPSFVPHSMMGGGSSVLQRHDNPPQFSPFASNLAPSSLYSAPSSLPQLFIQPQSQPLLSGHISPVPNASSPLSSSNSLGSPLGSAIMVGRNPVASPVSTVVDNINKLGVLGEHTSTTFISMLAALLDKPPALSSSAEVESFIDNNGIEAIGVAMFRFCKKPSRVIVGVMMLSHLADFRPALVRQHNGCSYALSVVGLHPNSANIHTEARKLLKKCGVNIPQRFFDANGCFRCRDLGLTNTLDQCRDASIPNGFEEPETFMCSLVLSMLRFPHETSLVRQCMEQLFPDSFNRTTSLDSSSMAQKAVELNVPLLVLEAAVTDAGMRDDALLSIAAMVIRSIDNSTHDLVVNASAETIERVMSIAKSPHNHRDALFILLKVSLKEISFDVIMKIALFALDVIRASKDETVFGGFEVLRVLLSSKDNDAVARVLRDKGILDIFPKAVISSRHLLSVVSDAVAEQPWTFLQLYFSFIDPAHHLVVSQLDELISLAQENAGIPSATAIFNDLQGMKQKQQSVLLQQKQQQQQQQSLLLLQQQQSMMLLQQQQQQLTLGAVSPPPPAGMESRRIRLAYNNRKARTKVTYCDLPSLVAAVCGVFGVEIPVGSRACDLYVIKYHDKDDCDDYEASTLDDIPFDDPNLMLTLFPVDKS